MIVKVLALWKYIPYDPCMVYIPTFGLNLW